MLPILPGMKKLNPDKNRIDDVALNGTSNIPKSGLIKIHFHGRHAGHQAQSGSTF